MEAMATNTMSQSASLESSLAIRHANHGTCGDNEGLIDRPQGELPSPPPELHDIADKNAGLRTEAADVRVSKQRFGNRNLYLPLLARKKKKSSTQMAPPVKLLAPRKEINNTKVAPPVKLPVLQSMGMKLPEPRDEIDTPTKIWPLAASPLPAGSANQNTSWEDISHTLRNRSLGSAPTSINSPVSTNETSEASVGFSSRDISGTSDISSVSDMCPVSAEQTDLNTELKVSARNPPKPPGLWVNFSLPGSQKERYSSSSMASQIESAPTIVPIPLTHYTVTKFDKKCYVSTDMPKPVEISRLWDESYQQLLREALQYSATARDDSESALALEFYMASTSAKNFKPSILLTCCSSKKKKALKSMLSDLRWLKESGLQYFVRVDKSFGYRACTIGVATGEPSPKIFAQLPEIPTTLCGTSARMTPKASSITGQPAINREVRFTIGGLLCIDGHYGYLTAGHPFALTSLKPQPSNSICRISNSEDSDSDSSISSTNPSSYDEPSMYLANYRKVEIFSQRPAVSARGSSTGTENSTPFRRLEHEGLMSTITSPCINLKMERNAFREFTFDWAFILATETLLLPNMIQIPGEDQPTSINYFVPIIDLVSGPVWVAAGSGLQLGTLNTTPVTVFLGGRFHEVRQITLDHCLGPYSPIMPSKRSNYV